MCLRSCASNSCCHCHFSVFFFNDTATTEIYTLSLHDALPISPANLTFWDAANLALYPTNVGSVTVTWNFKTAPLTMTTDRKSTRLNSSHANISYAVFCLKKKKKQIATTIRTR